MPIIYLSGRLVWKSTFPKNNVVNCRGRSVLRMLFNALWNCPERFYHWTIPEYMPVICFPRPTLSPTFALPSSKACFLLWCNKETNNTLPPKFPPHIRVGALPLEFAYLQPVLIWYWGATFSFPFFSNIFTSVGFFGHEAFVESRDNSFIWIILVGTKKYSQYWVGKVCSVSNIMIKITAYLEVPVKIRFFKTIFFAQAFKVV